MISIVIVAAIVSFSIGSIVGYNLEGADNISDFDVFLIKRFSARKATRISNNKDKKLQKEELYYILQSIRESANNGYTSISCAGDINGKNVKILKLLGYIVSEYEEDNGRWYRVEWNSN